MTFEYLLINDPKTSGIHLPYTSHPAVPLSPGPRFWARAAPHCRQRLAMVFRFLCVDSPCRNGEVQPFPTQQWSDILIFIAMFHGQNMFLDHGKMPWFPWVFNERNMMIHQWKTHAL